MGVLMFVQGKKARRASASNRAAKSTAKVHSVHALLKERQFAGGFDVTGSNYKLAYEPARAEVAGGKLVLRGRLTIVDSKGRARASEQVRATLEGTQGGLGASPVRRQLLAAGAQTGTVATPEQKQQLAGETDKKPDNQARTPASMLPLTESTGPESFCGVMYFRLEPLDAGALGVAADISRLQLNARLAPDDDTARTLQDLYTSIVEALYGREVNERLAAAAITEINKLFAAG
jgi:hypothetical protein